MRDGTHMMTYVCSPYGEFGTRRARAPLATSVARRCLYIKQHGSDRHCGERRTVSLRLTPIVVSTRRRHPSNSPAIHFFGTRVSRHTVDTIKKNSVTHRSHQMTALEQILSGSLPKNVA